MKPVVILGCGPAGLFAAQAIKEAGGHPIIHSAKKKSPIFGAQFLTRPIPGLTLPSPDMVESVRLGTKERYAQRVYGESATPSTWADAKHWQEPAWNMQSAYDHAWDMFEADIVDMKLDSHDVEEMTAFFPLVISTIPQWSICKGGHAFESISILITKECLYDHKEAENLVVYNGTQEDGWYRSSVVFGQPSTETVASDRSHMFFSGESNYESGFKIVGNDCDCHPNLVRAGRMGTWKRGVLTGHAYEAAIAAYVESTNVT